MKKREEKKDGQVSHSCCVEFYVNLYQRLRSHKKLAKKRLHHDDAVAFKQRHGALHRAINHCCNDSHLLTGRLASSALTCGLFGACHDALFG